MLRLSFEYRDGKVALQRFCFWVVKPQVGREGISGLGTLLSGAYGKLQPGKGQQPEDITC
jgi:paraquat-inducible protein B